MGKSILVRWLLGVALLTQPVSLLAREIALTFDDAPRAARGYLDGPTRARMLTTNLAAHDSGPVVFFAVSQRLDEEGRRRLATYAEAGHVIASHTHTHPDFNKSSFEQYAADFKLAHEDLSGFNRFVRWFRFPYLREGDTEQKRDGMRAVLAEYGYRNAYVTVNNYDWYMESLFQQAIANGTELDLDRVSRFYVSVLMEAVEYYDRMAIAHLGRSPSHVLLLHEMDITALFVGDLINELRAQGWRIITLEEAYEDPIAGRITSRVFPYNPGRVGEIARDSGQTDGLWHESCDEAYLDARFESEVLR